MQYNAPTFVAQEHGATALLKKLSRSRLDARNAAGQQRRAAPGEGSKS